MRTALYSLFLLFTCQLQAQDQIWLKELKSHVYHIYEDSTDELRSYHNEQFKSLLDSILLDPNSFTRKFDSLENLSVHKAPDNRFRIYTWTRPLIDGRFKYYGFVQIKPKKGEPFHIPLNEGGYSADAALESELSAEEWYGALYYKLIYHKHRRKRYYTLLGWRGEDSFVTSKLVDVITINRQDEITFGKKMFVLDDKKKQYRYIQRFGANIYSSLRWDKRKKRIVMDHLVPSKDELEGIWQFYGPDFSYDALEFKKGKWILKEDVDVRNRE